MTEDRRADTILTFLHQNYPNRYTEGQIRREVTGRWILKPGTNPFVTSRMFQNVSDKLAELVEAGKVHKECDGSNNVWYYAKP